jgi:hypothetical protein
MAFKTVSIENQKCFFCSKEVKGFPPYKGKHTICITCFMEKIDVRAFVDGSKKLKSAFPANLEGSTIG